MSTLRLWFDKFDLIHEKYIIFISTSLLGWAPSLPRLLHCPVFLHALAWELFLAGNQRSYWLLKPLRSLGTWRNSINQLGNNEIDVNLNICKFHRILSHWFPTRKSSHASTDKKTWTNERGLEREEPAEWRCNLARDINYMFHILIKWLVGKK